MKLFMLKAPIPVMVGYYDVFVKGEAIALLGVGGSIKFHLPLIKLIIKKNEATKSNFTLLCGPSFPHLNSGCTPS